MKRSKGLVLLLLVTLWAALQFSIVFLASTFVYTTVQVEIAKGRGIYATPEDGMRAKLSKGWDRVERFEIEYTGTNSFDGSNPHVWFVVARVYRSSAADGETVGGDDSRGGGSFFLRVEDGWVHIPEGAFPEFVGFGMRLFGIYGCREKSCE